jgi:hypothetical protein
MGQWQLISGITELSDSKVWDTAKLEWTLAEIIFAEEAETCVCGHYPILEVCVIANRINGNRARVGNVCVKKFLGLPSNKIFSAIAKVAKDDTKALNVEAIEFAHERGWIDDWSRDFYLNTWRKHAGLSDKQLYWRQRINQLVVAKTRQQ